MAYLSTHAEERVTERNIDPRLAELALLYGVDMGYGGACDKLLLKKENIPVSVLAGASRALLAHIDKQLPILAVVDTDDVVRTIYRVNSRINKTKRHSFKGDRCFAE